MKPVVRNIIAGIMLGLTVCLSGVLLFFSGTQRNAAICRGVDIMIRDSMKNRFISKADVREFVREDLGSFNGKNIKELNLRKVEESLKKRSAIKECEAFTTPDGKLNIEISQREPVVRFQKGNFGYYSDSEGYIFPLQRSHTAHVTIIDGHIPLNIKPGFKGEPETATEKEWLRKMLYLTECINSDRKWKENISQISVMENGDIIMVPGEGREKFIFGTPDRIKDKLSLMERYYTEIIPAKGAGTYSSVSVKYAGQIVCRKQD